MESKIGPSFKKVKGIAIRSISTVFTFMPNRTNVTPKQLSNISVDIWGRPVIATSRIDKYDGEMVTSLQPT